VRDDLEFLERLLERFSINDLLRIGVVKGENFTFTLRIDCERMTVEPSNSLSMPWNGWIIRDGSEVASFQAGALLQAWEHLRQCEKCRTINGVSERIAEAAVEALTEEWRKAVE
jgi:hypothetical protein